VTYSLPISLAGDMVDREVKAAWEEEVAVVAPVVKAGEDRSVDTVGSSHLASL
jgi:hypothetical protein